MEWVLLVAAGLFSGIVGALVGLGGGIILVPAIVYLGAIGWLEGITPQTVVGLSVLMMIFTGLSSTLAYMKKNTVDFKSGFIFFAGSAPGTVIGAFVNKGLDLPSFQLYFGVMMVFISILLLLRKCLKPVRWFVDHGKQTTLTVARGTYVYGYPIWFALLLTFIIGFSSGLFGISGGAMLVPAMILLFLFPPHLAVGTSMFMIFLSALVNSVTHISLGNVPWLYTIPVIPAAYIGAKVGAYLNQRLNSEHLVVALQIVLLLFGIRSIYEGIM
ncbi:sulfite exporter TauE/SafE family protein [Chryseomicrobium palamuruense]|uniref:Probable membrane transporter protein n=1 Tax=Chryseomicrobium palamuruense TaxID=682973 RepID=A0ABV8UUV0_9BACL